MGEVKAILGILYFLFAFFTWVIWSEIKQRMIMEDYDDSSS